MTPARRWARFLNHTRSLPETGRGLRVGSLGRDSRDQFARLDVEGPAGGGHAGRVRCPARVRIVHRPAPSGAAAHPSMVSLRRTSGRPVGRPCRSAQPTRSGAPACHEPRLCAAPTGRRLGDLADYVGVPVVCKAVAGTDQGPAGLPGAGPALDVRADRDGTGRPDQPRRVPPRPQRGDRRLSSEMLNAPMSSAHSATGGIVGFARRVVRKSIRKATRPAPSGRPCTPFGRRRTP